MAGGSHLERAFLIQVPNGEDRLLS